MVRRWVTSSFAFQLRATVFGSHTESGSKVRRIRCESISKLRTNQDAVGPYLLGLVCQTARRQDHPA